MKTIAFDVMGSDHGPRFAVLAALEFVKNNPDYKIILVGKKTEIDPFLMTDYPSAQLAIHDCPDVITSEDGILSVRRKPHSSLVEAFKLVKADKADAVVSAGSSAALLMAGHINFGEYPGVPRPAFMPIIPTLQPNQKVLLLDAGANLENEPADLLAFATMGIIFYNAIYKVGTPNLYLMNIGTEPSKGKTMHQAAFKLLSKHHPRYFQGNIEPRDLLWGKAQIVVTDGYAGNVALKSSEGTAKALFKLIRELYHDGNLRTKIGGALSKPVFAAVKSRFDYKNSGGALIMGLTKIAVKAHGSSDKQEFMSTLALTQKAVDADLSNILKTGLEKLNG